jgi:predicted AlkP superfamily phosphohydrolase/phosphomutase
MKTPVIAIGLDAADPTLIERWMAEGHLPTLSRLRQQGVYTRLNNIEYYKAETPWTTFLTGCSPSKTGHWTTVQFNEKDYTVRDNGAAERSYDFSEYSPFYALGDDYRVAVFDMPHSKLSDRVNGIQVLAWGTHSALSPSHSRPVELYQEIVDKHGAHPLLNNDHADTRNLPRLRELRDAALKGIACRLSACLDLLQRDEWDLFLTIFGETHSVGHVFWHLSQPDHPLHKTLSAGFETDPLLEVFMAIDQAIDKIIAHAPKNARFVIFSGHGMGHNVMDLPSMVFLPELLYRHNFPGKYGLAKGTPIGTPPGAPLTDFTWDWLGHLWRLKHDPNPILRALRPRLPVKAFNLVQKLLGGATQPDLVSPFQLRAEGSSVFYQTAAWYQPFWSQMKAFALPSFADGYIRINLKGREAQGIVLPEEYDAVCEELTQLLSQMTDARTGKPMVKKIIRTRQNPLDRDPKLPNADLVINWQEEDSSDVVDIPNYGRIGPIPHNRTGSHLPRGFFIAQGEGIAPASSLPTGHALDLAPTILTFMGVTPPDYMEGSPILEPAKPELVA